MSYSHCLHLSFTERVLKMLGAGNSVNVVIERLGEEVERFVADVRACPLPSETRLLVVDIRVCRHRFEQFLSELARQLELEFDDLTQVLSELERSRQRSIVVLNNFQALGESEVDPQFNRSFYEKLNALKNLDQVALLLITDRRQSEILFNIAGEWKTSQLDIPQVEWLPALSEDQARYELQQQCLQLSDSQVFQVLQQCPLSEGYDYNLLMCLAKQLRDERFPQEIPDFIKQLKRWKKRCQGKTWEYWLRKWIDGIQKFWGAMKLRNVVNKLWHLVADPLENLADLLKNLFGKSKD